MKNIFMKMMNVIYSYRKNCLIDEIRVKHFSNGNNKIEDK